MPRFAKARDANEKDIVKALRTAGWSVARLNPVDRADSGLPDLLIGKGGYTNVAEVKRPAGPRGGKKGKQLTDNQEEWHVEWNGACPLVLDSPSMEENVQRAEVWLRIQRGEFQR